MKLGRFIATLLPVLIGYAVNAQCTGDCCKKEKSAKATAATIKPSLMNETTQKKEISCKLTTPELQKRKDEVISVLKTRVLEKVELENGYKYRFASSDNMKDQISAFIKSEKACCDFFEFEYSVSGSSLWLTISGPEGAKDFIKKEMDL